MLIWPALCRYRDGARRIAADIRRERSGASAIEYALIAGIISLAIIAGATDIGTTLASSFAALGAAF